MKDWSDTERRLRKELVASYLPATLLHLDTVEAMSGLSRSTIYRRVKKKEFPAPITTGPKCTRWRAIDVNTWLNQQGAAT